MSQFHNGHQAETALKSTHCVCKIKAKSLNKSDKNGVKIHEIQMWLIIDEKNSIKMSTLN